MDGFGRMDPAQIYGGTTRSLAVTFQVHAMNGTDFDEMYYKINKLVQLVYPQWSAGTVRGFKDAASGKYGKFTTPFSQIPTASPMIRLRIGDLFSTNYSNLAIARLMGLGGPNFDLGLDDPPKPGGGDVDAIHSSGAAKNVGELVTRLKEEMKAAVDAKWAEESAKPDHPFQAAKTRVTTNLNQYCTFPSDVEHPGNQAGVGPNKITDIGWHHGILPPGTEIKSVTLGEEIGEQKVRVATILVPPVAGAAAQLDPRTFGKKISALGGGSGFRMKILRYDVSKKQQKNSKNHNQNSKTSKS